MQKTVRESDADVLELLALGQVAGQLTVGSLVSSNLMTVKVTLTAAQIKALAATQVELVAAPGADKVLEFVGGMARLVAGSEVLAENGGGSNLGIKFTDDAGVQVSEVIEMTGFIEKAVNWQTSLVPIKDALVIETGAVNQALVLDNIGAGEITGNISDDAELHAYVTYRIHDLS